MTRPGWLTTLMVRLPQILQESRERAQRRELLRLDARLEQELVIGGPAE